MVEKNKPAGAFFKAGGLEKSPFSNPSLLFFNLYKKLGTTPFLLIVAKIYLFPLSPLAQ